MMGGRWFRRGTPRCPPGWRLGQAASQGLTEPLATHVATCLRCAGELRALDALAMRARALGEATMPSSMRERIAQGLRAEAAGARRPWRSPRRRRWVPGAAIGLTLASGTLLAALWQRRDEPVRAPPARPAFVTGAAAPVQEMRVGNQEPTGVPPATIALSLPARRRKPAARPATATARMAIAEDAAPVTRAAFEDGWRLLRRGDFMAAAQAFAALERRSPGDAIVEDALFWRGIALGRAGEKAQARAALAAFLARFPRSARVGEACASLGWLLVDAGDQVVARALFERAARDPSDRVRASARAGLQHIELSDATPPPAAPVPAPLTR